MITGGARGQGAAHGRAFVAEGAKVVLTDVLEMEGQSLASDLGENALFIKHDVSSSAEWNTVIEETEKAFGPISVLVNNAAISFSKALEEMTEEEYRRVINSNQVSVFLGMKAVVPSMKKNGSGSIINISSIDGLLASATFLAYNASKFAGRGMTKTAALELAQYNIRVNSVHPGTVETPILDAVPPQQMENIRMNIPMKRAAKSEEVSKLILFLAEDASYSTGSEFIIDGGVTSKYAPL